MERLHKKGIRGEGAGVMSTEEREIAQCCTFTPNIGRGRWSSQVMDDHEVSPAGACLTFDDFGVATGDSRTRAFDAAIGRSPSPIKSPQRTVQVSLQRPVKVYEPLCEVSHQVDQSQFCKPREATNVARGGGRASNLLHGCPRRSQQRQRQNPDHRLPRESSPPHSNLRFSAGMLAPLHGRNG